MQTEPSGWNVYARLLRYTIPHWPQVAIAILGFAMVAAMNAAFAYQIQPLLDSALVDRDADVMIWLPTIMAGIFILRSAGSYLGIYYIGRVGHLVVKSLRSEMFERLLVSPSTFYDKTAAGTLLSKFSFDVERVSSASAKSMTLLVRDSFQVVFCLALMFYFSWRLTLVLLFITPLIAMVVMYASKRFRVLSRRLQSSIGDVTRSVEEAVSAHSIIKIFAGQEYEKERFEKANEKSRRNQTKIVATKAINTPVVQLLVGVTFSIVIYIAFQPPIIDELTPGTFMGFVSAVMLLLTSARKLTMINEMLQAGIAAGESIFTLIDGASEVDEGQHEVVKGVGEIEFEKVTFSYASKEEIAVQDVSFTAKAGQMVALVGRSGSGKSTLVKLLPRLYEIDSGHIRVDGHDIQSLRLDSLRKQLSIVSQDIVLFEDTIANNIAYASAHDVTREQVIDAAKAAHVMEFVEKMPNGLDTEVGAKGVMLSGGQRQRIAIARALLKDAPILILDEATSSLDSESEQKIQAALEVLEKNRTTLVIAHRLSTVERADLIIVMDEGRIIEQGSHQQLLANNGVYTDLHKHQMVAQDAQAAHG